MVKTADRNARPILPTERGSGLDVVVGTAHTTAHPALEPPASARSDLTTKQLISHGRAEGWLVVACLEPG